MVAPITGPTVRSIADNTANVQGGYRFQQVYKQAKPYNLPLPYFGQTGYTDKGWDYQQAYGMGYSAWWTGLRAQNVGGPHNTVWYPGRTAQFGAIPELSWALNRAREKFFSEANQRIGLAVDALQCQQTLDLITGKTNQLIRFTRALKRGRLKEAFDSVNRSQREWQTATRTLGSHWLMWSYGAKPLIEDIYKSGQIFGAPFGSRLIKFSSGQKVSRAASTVVPPYETFRGEHNYNVICQVGGVVTLTNPNLQVWKNAGFTNPVAWAWELIPFSFVADWFANIGDMIESLDDTVGISVTDGWYTTFWSGTSSFSYRNAYPTLPFKNLTSWKAIYATEISRVRGTPSVKLVASRKVLSNLSRGANAASLLSQLLRKQ